MNLTREEINALISYQGSEYIEINNILNFDLAKYRKNLDGDLNFFLKENIRSYIETIKLIYSAMCKYSKSQVNNIQTGIYRGTTLAEINNIKKTGICSNFLSTSNSKELASNYAIDQKDSALINFVSAGVPFFYMPSIVDENVTFNIDEKEIILAPFAKVGKIRKAGVESIENKEMTVFDVTIEEFDRSSVEPVEKNDEEEIIEEYASLKDKYIEYSNIMSEISKLDADLKNGNIYKIECDERINSLKNRIKELEADVSVISRKMVNYLKSSFIEIEENIEKQFEIEDDSKNIEKEIEEERQAEILNRPKKLVAEVDSSKNYLDYQINSIKSQIDKINRKLHIDGFDEVESLGIDLSSVKKEIDNDFFNKFQKVLEQLEEVQKEIESITASEDMDVEELSKVTSKLHQKEDYVREISISVTFIDSNILPQAINKYTSEVKTKLNEKVAQKLHEAESKKLKEKISENKKSMSSPFSKFGKKNKSLRLMDEYLTNRLSNNELGNFDSINPVESVDNYLKNYQDEFIIELSEKLQKIPDSLKSISSNQKYEIESIPEIPNEKDKLEKFEMEMELLINEQKSRSNNGRNDGILNLRKELESNVENSDISYRFESIFRNLRNLSKDENTTKNSTDISDILRDENEQVI